MSYDVSHLLNLGQIKTILQTLSSEINSRYKKPSTGIPASDLASGVIPDAVLKTGDTMSGTLHIDNPSSDWSNPPGFFMKNPNNRNMGFKLTENGTHADFGWEYSANAGALMSMISVDDANYAGCFDLVARDATNTKVLRGTPAGELKWNDKKVLTANDVSFVVNPNILDNAIFVGGGSQNSRLTLPINTNGLTTYNAIGDTINRWFHESTTGTIVLHDDFLNWYTSSSGNDCFIQTAPKDYALALVGKTLTLSVLETNGAFYTKTFQLYSSGSDYVSDTLHCSSGLDVCMHYFTGSNSYQLCRFTLSSNKNCEIKAVKLELGDIQTLAHEENNTWILNEIGNYNEQLLRSSYRTNSEISYPLYRQQALFSSDTTPLQNGNINWTYA